MGDNHRYEQKILMPGVWAALVQDTKESIVDNWGQCGCDLNRGKIFFSKFHCVVPDFYIMFFLPSSSKAQCSTACMHNEFW